MNGSFVTKTRFDEINNAKKQLETDIKDRDKQLDDLKKVDAAGLQRKLMNCKLKTRQKDEQYQAKLKRPN
ncbi:phage scaffolding protein [Anaerobacillus sp. HL2]|nr:phage scaffolding protein [Anaerobacillus sp. HL2]